MPNDIITRHRPTMIKGLIPTLPERGKIKIGIKAAMRQSRNGNKFQPPQKLDHFLLTTMERGQDGNFLVDRALHNTLGEKPTEIPIRLLYDDPALNFPSRYARFDGRTLACSGDGEVAMELTGDKKGYQERSCPCEKAAVGYDGKDKCKMNAALSCIIDGGGRVGGVHKFRTTSYNSIVGIMSSMAFLRSVTGGVISNIPLKLIVRPKQGTDPKGMPVTVYVVGLEYAGDIESLQEAGHRIALQRATTHISIAEIETEARRQLAIAPPTVNAPLPGDDADDVLDEFYAEEAFKDVARHPDSPVEQTSDKADHVQDQIQDEFWSPPDEPPASDDTPPDFGADEFELVGGDGEITTHATGELFVHALIAAMDDAPNSDFLDGIWESNSGQLQAVRDKGPASLADDAHAAYAAGIDRLRPKQAPDLPEAAAAYIKGKFWRSKTFDLAAINLGNLLVPAIIFAMKNAPTPEAVDKLFADNEDGLKALPMNDYNLICDVATQRQAAFLGA